MAERAPAAPPHTGHRLLLAVLGFCSFAAMACSHIVAPLLGDLSKAFDVSVPVAGQLVAAYALPSALLCFVLGPLADRYGRGWLLLLGMLVLAAASAASAVAWSFPALMVFRGIAGLGAAAMVPATFGAVGDHFPPEQRGRAVALLVSASTLGGMIGVPLGALLAQVTDWRFAVAAMALPLVLAAAVVWRQFPPERPARAIVGGDYLAGYRAVLHDPGAVPVLLAWLLSSTSWFAWQTYVGPFFQHYWALSTGALAPILFSMGVAVLLGANLGGRLADGHGKIRVAVVCLITVGALTAAVAAFVRDFWLAAAVNFVLCIPNAGRFTVIAAMATERAPSGRATMFSIGVAAGQSAQLLGAGLGGLMIDVGSYAALGLVAGTLSWTAAGILLRRADPDPPPRPLAEPAQQPAS